MRRNEQKVEMEDESSDSDLSGPPLRFDFEPMLNQENHIKSESLARLDVKLNHLVQFIGDLPPKLRQPVNIGSTHPDIEVPWLEGIVGAERLLELAGNTIRK